MRSSLSFPSRAARPLLALAVASFGLAACGSSSDSGTGSDAENYPTENINVIVPFAAGGPTDTVTRLVGESMSEDLGRQLVVKNVEGAGGTVGGAEAAKADPDGYTILMHHIGMSTAPALYAKLPYKPQEDFEPIGLVTEVPMTIVARKDFAPTDLKGLIDHVKANAETVTYAHAGKGSASHLCGTLLQKELGVKFQEVPYDGTGPAIADLVGRQVDFMCDQTTNTSGQIKGKEVKAYAVTTPERVASLPDIPTTAEAGLPNMELTIWHGLYAPKGTPKAAIDRLNKALGVALKDTNVVTKMADLGTAPVPETDIAPDRLATKLKEQTDLWGGLLTPGK